LFREAAITEVARLYQRGSRYQTNVLNEEDKLAWVQKVESCRWKILDIWKEQAEQRLDYDNRRAEVQAKIDLLRNVHNLSSVTEQIDAYKAARVTGAFRDLKEIADAEEELQEVARNTPVPGNNETESDFEQDVMEEDEGNDDYDDDDPPIPPRVQPFWQPLSKKKVRSQIIDPDEAFDTEE
jgi:hypothetical protein